MGSGELPPDLPACVWPACRPTCLPASGLPAARPACLLSVGCPAFQLLVGALSLEGERERRQGVPLFVFVTICGREDLHQGTEWQGWCPNRQEVGA